jgi:hypothetical protein
MEHLLTNRIFSAKSVGNGNPSTFFQQVFFYRRIVCSYFLFTFFNGRVMSLIFVLGGGERDKHLTTPWCWRETRAKSVMFTLAWTRSCRPPLVWTSTPLLPFKTVGINHRIYCSWVLLSISSVTDHSWLSITTHSHPNQLELQRL